MHCMTSSFIIFFASDFRLQRYSSSLRKHSKRILTGKRVLKWLKVFYKRFFTQQFKRSCLPDGVKIGSVCLSPRGDWRMPSDASYAIWLREIEEIKIKTEREEIMKDLKEKRYYNHFFSDGIYFYNSSD